MKKLFLSLAILTTIASCSKKDSDPTDDAFTPPTTNYLILDGQEHDSASAFALYVPSIPEFDVRQATFTGITLTPPLTRIGSFRMLIESLTYSKSSQNPTEHDLHDSIPEGGYVKYTLPGVSTSDHKYGFLVYVTLTLDETYTTPIGSNSGGNGYYLSGNLYVSKLNGKLRYTTDGTISVSNETNTTLKHTIKFSIAEDAGTF